MTNDFMKLSVCVIMDQWNTQIIKIFIPVKSQNLANLHILSILSNVWPCIFSCWLFPLLASCSSTHSIISIKTVSTMFQTEAPDPAKRRCVWCEWAGRRRMGTPRVCGGGSCRKSGSQEGASGKGLYHVNLVWLVTLISCNWKTLNFLDY